jgi:hypothetical protein
MGHFNGPGHFNDDHHIRTMSSRNGHGSSEQHGSHGKRSSAAAALSSAEQQQQQRPSKRPHLDSPRTRSPPFPHGGESNTAMVRYSDVVVATEPFSPKAVHRSSASPRRPKPPPCALTGPVDNFMRKTLPPDHELLHGRASLSQTSPEQLSTADSLTIATCAGIVNPYAKRKCYTLSMESSIKEGSLDCGVILCDDNKVESFLNNDGGGKSGVKGRMWVYEPVPPLDSLAVAASRLAVQPVEEQAAAVNSLEPKNADDFPLCLVHFPLGRLRTRPDVSFSWLDDGVIEVNESLGRHYYIGFKLKGVDFYKGDVVRLSIVNEEFPFGQTYRKYFIIVSAFQATKSFLGRYGKNAEAEIQHRGMEDCCVWIVLLSAINRL